MFAFSNRPKQRFHKAFSLVEILVVLAIVGLIAALLLPVFNGVRTTARITTCQSNLRQIGVGLQLYLNDHRGLYPSLLASPTNCTWSHNVAPYLKSEKIFTCPENPDLFFKSGCPAPEPQGEITLAFHGGYTLDVPDSGRSPQMSERQIRMPASMILVIDGDGDYTNAGPGTGAITAERLEEMAVHLRHRGGANALFADGHVKWLSQTAVTKRSLWTLSGREF